MHFLALMLWSVLGCGKPLRENYFREECFLLTHSFIDLGQWLAPLFLGPLKGNTLQWEAVLGQSCSTQKIQEAEFIGGLPSPGIS